MDLRWWPLAIFGMIALVVCIAVAALWPLPEVRRILRPLANVERLTRLPEYGRVDRTRFLAMVITGVLLLIVFCAALFTSARPIGLSSSTRDFEGKHPEDIMLCVGEPVTDSATAGFLNYFADRADSFTNQQIGLTSSTLRVVPLTRDHRFAADEFDRYAKLPALHQDYQDSRELSGDEVATLRNGINDFSRQVRYVDYARSTEDILALCMAGFPSYDSPSTHRRSIIYLGLAEQRRPAETRPALFSQQQIKEMAAAGGFQINVLSRSDVPTDSPEANEGLASIAEASGGKFYLYNPGGTGASAAGTDATLAAHLDEIRANPPGVVLPGGHSVSHRTWDYPNVPLLVSIAAALLLCLSLAVLRR